MSEIVSKDGLRRVPMYLKIYAEYSPHEYYGNRMKRDLAIYLTYRGFYISGYKLSGKKTGVFCKLGNMFTGIVSVPLKEKDYFSYFFPFINLQNELLQCDTLYLYLGKNCKFPLPRIIINALKIALKENNEYQFSSFATPILADELYDEFTKRLLQINVNKEQLKPLDIVKNDAAQITKNNVNNINIPSVVPTIYISKPLILFNNDIFAITLHIEPKISKTAILYGLPILTIYKNSDNIVYSRWYNKKRNKNINDTNDDNNKSVFPLSKDILDVSMVPIGKIGIKSEFFLHFLYNVSAQQYPEKLNIVDSVSLEDTYIEDIEIPADVISYYIENGILPPNNIIDIEWENVLKEVFSQVKTKVDIQQYKQYDLILRVKKKFYFKYLLTSHLATYKEDVVSFDVLWKDKYFAYLLPSKPVTIVDMLTTVNIVSEKKVLDLLLYVLYADSFLVGLWQPKTWGYIREKIFINKLFNL